MTIILGGALAGGSVLAGAANYDSTNYGLPISYGGQQYYIPNDSRRAVYPSQQDCKQDVPADRLNECEPRSSYIAGAGGYYGPVYNPRDTYQPSSKFPTETASSSNVGKTLPKGSSPHGFGSNGKAFTGSKGS